MFFCAQGQGICAKRQSSPFILVSRQGLGQIPQMQSSIEQQYTRKLTKDQINELPLLSYDGPIHLVNTPKDAILAANELSKEPILGFDTEKRPAFRKGQVYQPSLLQLANADAVFLFQLKLTGLPAEVLHLLTHKQTVKAGVAVRRDVQELQEMKPFEDEGFVDLGHKGKDAGLRHHGLRGLAAVLLGGRISKGAKLTNWARIDLPEQALKYAATDAWVGRALYQAMHDMGIDMAI